MPIDVRVNTVASTVRVTDADALLSPEILDRIVRAVVERLEDERARRREREEDKAVREQAARLP